MVVMSAKTDTKDFDRVMRLAGERGAGILAAALGEEIERIGKVAEPHIPIESGALRRSFWAGSPQGDQWYRKVAANQYRLAARRFTIRFGFGRDDVRGRRGVPTSVYALIQHENMRYRHPRGGGPKYLTRAINSSIPGMESRMRAKMTAAWNATVR